MLNRLARYATVARLVDETGGTTLLDVGSGSKGIVDLLEPRWDVTAADVSFDDYGASRTSGAGRSRRVEASVLDLPFPDASFDVVVCIDMLEHIEPSQRPRAVSELVRVTRRRLVLACPCGTGALDSDRRLAAWYRRLRRETPGWLAEHLANGFPEPDDLGALLDGGGRHRLQPNESLWAHRWIGYAEASPVVGLLSSPLSRVLEPGARSRGGLAHRSAAACLRVLRGGDAPPGYRTVAVLDREP
jgi:SAM-dependent methyltransferase